MSILNATLTVPLVSYNELLYCSFNLEVNPLSYVRSSSVLNTNLKLHFSYLQIEYLCVGLAWLHLNGMNHDRLSSLLCTPPMSGYKMCLNKELISHQSLIAMSSISIFSVFIVIVDPVVTNSPLNPT